MKLAKNNFVVTFNDGKNIIICNTLHYTLVDEEEQRLSMNGWGSSFSVLRIDFAAERLEQEKILADHLANMCYRLMKTVGSRQV